jgi:hypothetical protein
LLTRLLLVAGALVLALSSAPVAADPTGELEQLRQDAATLRQSLERLDARIHRLESQSQDPSSGKSVETPAPVVAPAPVVSPAPAATPAPVVSPAPAPAAATAAATAASMQPIVSLKRNWSQIERGIPQDKVQSLLGPPEKVLQIDGSTVWYYTYPGIGRGSVFFNRDGKVSSAQSPTFGWGW